MSTGIATSRLSVRRFGRVNYVEVCGGDGVGVTGGDTTTGVAGAVMIVVRWSASICRQA
jgi:hypothetical protein